MKYQCLYIESDCSLYERQSSYINAQHVFMAVRAQSMKEGIEKVADMDLLYVVVNGSTVKGYKSGLRALRKATTAPIFILENEYCMKEAGDVVGLGADAYSQVCNDPRRSFDLIMAYFHRFWDRGHPHKDIKDLAAYGGVVIFPSHNIAIIDGVAIELSEREAQILHLFVVNKGKFLTYQKIRQHIGYAINEVYDETKHRSLCIAVGRLSRKIKAVSQDVYIKNWREYGYGLGQKNGLVKNATSQ